jgi:hypothetical protein
MILSEGVYEIAEKFMTNPVYVSINFERLDIVAETMNNIKPPTFPFPTVPDKEDVYKDVLLELVGGAINYCYWYGRDDVRPGGASSTFMYENLQNAFFDYNLSYPSNLSSCIDNFIQNLTFKRFPLLEERIKHLEQLTPFGEDFIQGILDSDRKDLEPHMNNLLAEFPGYASDIFLKRASLFFLQLHRRFGWFAEEMKTLHIPADYQVPKIMNHEGIIEYDTELGYEIDTRRPIPKGSQKECEIRAATIHVAKMLGENTSWNVAEIDGYFWLRRKEALNPFHLTITTDY